MDIAVVEPTGPAPLVVTADAALRERILLLCAASGVTPRVVDGAGEARAEWRSASCVAHRARRRRDVADRRSTAAS